MTHQPGYYDITLQRRADFTLQLQFKDSDSVPIDLTGATVYAQAWSCDRTTKLADFAVVYTDRVQGTVRLTLTNEQTTTFPTQLCYDVMLEDSQGFRSYYLEGSIRISEGYTIPEL
jgi:hypothetical protein